MKTRFNRIKKLMGISVLVTGMIFLSGNSKVSDKEKSKEVQKKNTSTTQTLNGQVKQAVDPENKDRNQLTLPATGTQQMDNSSWAVKLWLRAEDLASAGLKPGDPVKQWNDASWGIRFSPNPKPPYSDKTPTFAEQNVAGNPDPVPVVRFDGESSLRQLDLFNVVDEKMTAFVVYLPLEDRTTTWKELFAKRDGAMCFYADRITNSLRASHLYTPYTESGIRLGANDFLPLALTGHQGEFNSGERFKGYIAEVIVFARHFGPEDKQEEMVKNYLQEKYFSVTSKDKAALQAPWAAAKPAGLATPVKATEKPVGKANLLPETDNSVALNQVSIFSLTEQENLANMEYAAGDVTLPFSYSAKVSTVPRPQCLDFPGQPNPDCCHPFIRIDGELWMFRIDWIAGKGRPARYKGPDIDHMTRVEDGTYPPEVGLGWFLGGMWYDESQRKLYAPVHIEQEGRYRRHPVVSWASRKIALATSIDKGKTWKYEGDIITPETYYFNHETYKFSGSFNGNGVADFGFYFDPRGGYFYIFPDESWYMKGQSGGLWGVRAARCAINDKMAPGKWKYFYNGKWDEPALGGKSTMVAPSHFWGVIYSSYLDKYICIFPSNLDPLSRSQSIDGVMIGACSDLSKQDWVWGYCPEAMFGFMTLFNQEGTNVVSCDQTFRHYAFGSGNTFRQLDITLEKEPMTVNNWMPRFLFEPHPESSDPILSRKTRIVGSASPEMLYSGSWTDKNDDFSYEGKFRESKVSGSSIEFSFKGSDVYWRAVRSPMSGKADVYIDGILRKTVDCFSPRSMSCEVFVYLKTGLDPNKTHTIKIVVRGEKNPKSEGTTIGHIAIEYSAESYKASAGFCSMMGKNNWYYQQRQKSIESDMRFIPRDDIFVKDWFGEGNSRIGNNYQIPEINAESVRKWVAPHGGVVRVEGRVAIDSDSTEDIFGKVLHNADALWQPKQLTHGHPDSHDLTVKVEQGDEIRFIVGTKSAGGKNANAGKVMWDPVITYTESIPPVWKPNAPGNKNIAFGRYGRSKMLAYTYQPFNAVDGNMSTDFAIYADDKISSGDDWFQLDLEKMYMIDHYAMVSKPQDITWRPNTFKLQKSDDGFVWVDVDSVLKNTSERFERTVPAFTARYVRLYLPKGKPFSINEFELYYTGEKEK